MTTEVNVKEILAAINEQQVKYDDAIAEARELGENEVKAVKEEMLDTIKELRGEVESLQAKNNRFGTMNETEVQKAEYSEVFNKWVQHGDDYEKELRQKSTDLQISTSASGGYALPEELVREIIKLEHEQSPIRSLCDVKQASTTDIRQLVGLGSAASGWVGETTARTQTNTPDLAERTPTFGEVYAMPRAYQHVLEDAYFDVESWLAEEVAREFSEQENVAFLSGDGTNKPVGILNGLTLDATSSANNTTGVFGVKNTGVDNSLGATDAAKIDFLRTVPLTLKTGYLKNAVWMMNRNTHNALINLKNGDGEYFLQRNLTEAGAEKLFGYRIVINEDMADIDEAADSAPIIFGDFKRAFRIYDRVGVSTLRDPYTNKGSVMFYTRKRVGSMVLNSEALVVVGVNHV